MVTSGLRCLQVMLFTTAVVCLAFSIAVTERNKATRQQLEPVIDNLRQLRESKAISSEEYFSMTDQFRPLLFPTVFDPWLLRCALPTGSMCILLSSLISMFMSSRWKPQEEFSEAEILPAMTNGRL